MGHTIEVQNLSKRYRLGESVYRYRTLRETISSSLRRRNDEAGNDSREVWALREVDLAVEEGESIGVIGSNGAGKTTLLRILARVTEPTSGVVRTRGRVGALIQIGTGFHPELTGRENIDLNGAVLGMSRRDIRSRFDEIVEFAGVERFLDTPLKRYSSGMSLRLAFAVAAHLEPDIVVVDEVLAVGDAEFQRRCLGKMSDLRGEGRTVVFVSHDLGAITQLCGRAIWLDKGVLRADGPSHEITGSYLESIAAPTRRAAFATEAGKPVQLLSVAVGDEFGSTIESPHRDLPFSISVRFVAREKVPGLDIGVWFLNDDGLTVLDEVWSDQQSPDDKIEEVGEYEVSLTIPAVLPSGVYIVGTWIGARHGFGEHDTFADQEVLSFELRPSPDDRRDSIERRRIVQPQVAWNMAVTPVRRQDG